jgi:hypothetical protein
MTDLKRDEIKYIRDLSKSSYKKEGSCYICGTTENLQFHHFFSMTPLWNKWKRENDIIILSVEDILKYRDIFRQDHYHEIYEETVTLCKFHHMEKLHKIYGKVPPLPTALKQKNWCGIQRQKYIDSLKEKQ